MFHKIKKAKDPTSTEEAYAYALRLLEFRFRGVEELRARLVEKGFVRAVIIATLEKLSNLKYLDDNRLLEGLIREYKEFGLYGPEYIRQKLYQRKFPREQVQQAVGEFYPREDELIVVRKFMAKQKSMDWADVKSKQRLMQKLARRGFSSSTVYGALQNDL